MKKIISLVNDYEGFGRTLNPNGSNCKEFNEFSKKLRAALKEAVKGIGAELVSYSKGYYDANGFIQKNDKFVYFSVSGVDSFGDTWIERTLIRTARDSKDYTGGMNNFVRLVDFAGEVEKLLQ